jgi:hemolysin-activating ACP:hemolysin acyltransferase
VVAGDAIADSDPGPRTSIVRFAAHRPAIQRSLEKYELLGINWIHKSARTRHQEQFSEPGRHGFSDISCLRYREIFFRQGRISMSLPQSQTGISVGTQNQDFIRASLRHLAALSGAARKGEQPEPFPPDWFDWPQEMLADLGAMSFLAALNPFHQMRSHAQLITDLEPALRLGQYRIFRSDGYPRAFVTWAGLAPSAERRLALEHRTLEAHQWNSGASKWIIDLVAPFGHLEQVLDVLAQRPEERRVRTLWHNRPGTRYRIMEWTRDYDGAPIHLATYGVGQFARILDAGDT